jgi:ABC-type bacteriocin/lantibiotic exporter with double-glycine peptidase domain
MEKTWFPQRSTIDSAVALLKNFVHFIGHPISRLTIENNVKSHSEFPLLSFEAISQLLKSWGLLSRSYTIKLEQLKKFPSPSLLFIHDQKGGIK